MGSPLVFSAFPFGPSKKKTPYTLPVATSAKKVPNGSRSRYACQAWEDDMTVAKNAPCPCGSGLKYKRCHMPSQDTAQLQPIPWLKIVALVLTSIAMGILVGVLKEPPVGVAATFATGLGLVCWIWLFKPPSSVRGREDSASLNFGHQPEKRTRTQTSKPRGPSAPPRHRGKRR